MKTLLPLFLLFSFAAQANDCAELTKCIETVSKLTGKKYLYSKDVKGALQASSNTQITAENADTLFTYILELNDYARVPTAEKDTYMVISARDLRYHSFPTISTDASNPPKIPANNDYYMMIYRFTNYLQGQGREVANSLRPFMSRYGRIIESQAAGTVTLQENGSKLLMAYEMIKRADRQLTAAEIKARKEREEKEEKKAMRNEKSEKEEKKEEKKQSN